MATCSCSEGEGFSDNNGANVAIFILLAIAVIALVISVVINIVQHKRQSRCVIILIKSNAELPVVHRYDINQSNLRSRINQSALGNSRFDVEQIRYSEVKQSMSGSNTITDSTIRETLRSSEPECETINITTDPKPPECANNESWL